MDIYIRDRAESLAQLRCSPWAQNLPPDDLASTLEYLSAANAETLAACLSMLECQAVTVCVV
jgi:hypothetical protein